MAYEFEHFTKSSVQDANTRPFAHARYENFPTQSGTSVGHLGAESGEIFGDLQRSSIIDVYYIKGDPSEAVQSPLLSKMKIGDPHPWVEHDDPFKSAFLVSAKTEYVSYGATEDETEDAQAWTKVTLIYQQRPCPYKFEEHTRVATIATQEWYTNPGEGETGPPLLEFLTGTHQAIPVLRRVPIVTRHWPKCYLSAADRTLLYSLVGKLNPKPFLGHAPGMWMLDGVDMHLLYEESDPSDEEHCGHYELTLSFRADLLRKHAWYWPQMDPQTHRPRTPDLGDTYDSLHDKRYIYSIAPDEGDFNKLPNNAAIQGRKCKFAQ